MTALLPKWEDLWKAFESVRKSEWLKSDQVGKFNAMVKEAPGMKPMLTALDANEVDLLDACGNRRGKTLAEAPLYLKTYVNKLAVLKKGDLKKLAKASYDEMDKATKPKTYRALKVLITGIEEIETLAEYTEKTLIDAAKNAGKVVTSAERVQSVQDMALVQVKKAIAKSLALLQKAKADPTPAGWTAFMNGGGTRDVIMGLTSLVGAQKKGGFGQLPGAQGYKTQCDPWNVSQPMATLQPTDGAPEVTAKIKTWSGLVKSIATAYSPHW